MESEEKQPIKTRSAARLVAVQCIYSQVLQGFELESAEDWLKEYYEPSPAASEYFSGLHSAVVQNREDFETRISELLAKGWTLQRISKTDLACLLVASAELWAMPGIPPKVTIHEAVRVAKLIGNEESGRFVNGVLGKLLEQSPKAEWDPSLLEKRDDFEPEEEQLVPVAEEEQPSLETVTSPGWVIRAEDE